MLESQHFPNFLNVLVNPKWKDGFLQRCEIKISVSIDSIAGSTFTKKKKVEEKKF